MTACASYSVKPNSGIMTALRYDLEYIRPTPPFHDRDILPLADVLIINQNSDLRHVTRLDFT